MEESHQSQCLSTFCNPAENMSNKGCKLISRASLPQLLHIDICRAFLDTADNCIESEGMVHISKTRWKKLNSISLRNKNDKNRKK